MFVSGTFVSIMYRKPPRNLRNYIPSAALATAVIGSLNSGISPYTMPMSFDVDSTVNICVPASIDTAAATHGIAKPLECLVTMWLPSVSYTHLRAHETVLDLVC